MNYGVTDDQASDLRQLVFKGSKAASLADARRLARTIGQSPRIVLVTSGKGGVGTTTVAVHLAAALGADGQRVVLVDADVHGPDASTLCGLDEQEGIAELLAGRRDVHEVLFPGPCGIQVLPGNWRREPVNDTGRAIDRLMEGLARLSGHTDAVLVDAGSMCTPLVRRLWNTCSRAIVVTATDAMSVMGAYATIKSMRSAARRRGVYCVVNQSLDESHAAHVAERLAQACRKFLAARLAWGGWLPCEPDLGSTSPDWHALGSKGKWTVARRELEKMAIRLARTEALEESAVSAQPDEPFSPI